MAVGADLGGCTQGATGRLRQEAPALRCGGRGPSFAPDPPVRSSRTKAAAASGRPRGRAGGQRWRPWSSKPHPIANRSRTRRPPGTPGSCGRPPGRCPERRRGTRGGGEGQVDHRTGGEEARWCCGGAHTHRHRWPRRLRPRGTDTHATRSASYAPDAADLALRDEDGRPLGVRDLTGQKAPNRGRGSLSVSPPEPEDAASRYWR